MSLAQRHPAGPYAWSLALHGTLLAALGLGATLTQREVVVVPMPIQAVVVDAAVLAALDAVRREDDAIARQAAELLERQHREDQARLERERLERDQQAAETQAREQAQQRERADLEARRKVETETRRKAQADAAQRRKLEAEAAAKHKAEADARAREQAERQRQAEDARTRAQREAELRARLADEEQRTMAVAGGLRAQYVAMIQARIQRNWIRPASARPGLKCTVQVTQIPGGAVVGATLGTCNGDDAVRQSIVSAVLRSSPLPTPPDPSLFERNLVIEFVPED